MYRIVQNPKIKTEFAPVDPPASINGVESADNGVELPVEGVILVLDVSKDPAKDEKKKWSELFFHSNNPEKDERSDFDASNSLHDELCGHNSLGLAHILLPAKEEGEKFKVEVTKILVESSEKIKSKNKIK